MYTLLLKTETLKYYEDYFFGDNPNWVEISTISSIIYDFLTLIIIISAIFSVFISLYIARRTSRQNDNHNKTKLSLEFQKEFSLLLPIRIELDENLYKFSGEFPSSHSLHVEYFTLIAFYERLYFALVNNYADRSLIIDQLGYLFVYWYRIHFKEKIGKKDFGAVRHMHDLYAWFLREVRPEIFSQWLDRVDQERVRIMNKPDYPHPN